MLDISRSLDSAIFFSAVFSFFLAVDFIVCFFAVVIKENITEKRRKIAIMLGKKRKELLSQNSSRTEPTKRRVIKPLRFVDDSSEEEEEDDYYLVSFDNTTEFSVVDSSKIIVDADEVKCTVRDRGKWHKATMLKKGTKYDRKKNTTAFKMHICTYIFFLKLYCTRTKGMHHGQGNSLFAQ